MELRREIEASAINLGVCTRFFAENMDLDENYQKVELYFYGAGGGSRQRLRTEDILYLQQESSVIQE